MVHDAGQVQPKMAAQLQAANAAIAAAEADVAKAKRRRAELIKKALDSGGSLRAVGDLLGLSHTAVRKIAVEAGWTAEVWHQAQEEKRRRDEEWAAMTRAEEEAAGVKSLDDYGPKPQITDRRPKP